MALTCDFKETIKARVQRDPAFREELKKKSSGAYALAMWTLVKP